MNPGYVYILINPSLPGFIKIGKTLRDSRERARELYSTGVPTPYQVAFEIFSEEHAKLEALAHSELADFRVSKDREFFRYPLDKAITILQQLNSPPSSIDSVYSAEDITERLREKFSRYIKPDVVSIRVVQSRDRVWFEITQEKEIAGYLRDQSITRTDLGFISGSNNENYFNPNDSVSLNAERFIDDFCDPDTIRMLTDLFHEDACKELDEIYNSRNSLK